MLFRSNSPSPAESTPHATLTIGETAVHLNVSKKTVLRRIKDGSLAAFAVGRAVRIRREAIDAFIAENAFKTRRIPVS